MKVNKKSDNNSNILYGIGGLVLGGIGVGLLKKKSDVKNLDIDLQIQIENDNLRLEKSKKKENLFRLRSY